MKTSTKTAIAATALAVALAITGCTTTGVVPAPAPTAATSAPAAPEATLVPAKVGETLTDGVELAEGQRGYDLDGTLVAVAADQPLPKLVMDDIVAKAAATPKWNGQPLANGNNSVLEAMSQSDVAANQLHNSTGKSVIRINHISSNCAPDEPIREVFAVSGIGACSQFTTFEAAMAAANAFVARQSNPAIWIVVDYG